jgi:hypothetical protein
MFTRSVPALIAVSAVLAAAFLSSGAASAASSTAYGIGAQFTSGGVSTSLAPIASIQDTTPPNYNKSVAVPAVNQVLNIASGPGPGPALFVTGASLKSHVKGSFGVDTFSSEGDAALKTVDLNLNLNPPPPVAPVAAIPVPIPPLTVSAEGVSSQASFSGVVPLTPTINGSAGFKSLKISGSLVGNQVLTFKGPAAPNTILYQSPTATAAEVPAVTITLDKQIPEVIISCHVPPGCVTIPAGLTTEALDISLNNVSIYGTVISGDIVVGYDSAQ